MGRPRLTYDQMTEKQIQKRKINERYKERKKMGTLLNMPGSKNVDEKVIDNGNVPVKKIDTTRVEVCSFKDGIDKMVNKNGITWSDLEEKLQTPRSIFHAGLIVSITSYLVYQNILGMKQLDVNIFSSISSSIVSEMIPISCAGLLCFAEKRRVRIGLFAILAVSFFGLSSFFESSIHSNMDKTSDIYVGLMGERETLSKFISNQDKEFNSLPENNRAKKHEITENIKKANEELSKVNSKIENFDGVKSSKSSGFYLVWIRICAILVNSYLAHSFFSIFRRNP